MSFRRMSNPRLPVCRTIAVLAALLATTFTMVMPATGVGSIGDFDGVYEVVRQQTATTIYVSPSLAPSTSTSSVTMTVTVENGVLTDPIGQIGAITNPNGSGLLRIPSPGLGWEDCVGPLQFTRDSAGNLRFTGRCETRNTANAWFSTSTVIRDWSGAGSADSIRFTVPVQLPTAQRGKAYLGKDRRTVSFCEPRVAPGRLCGGGLGPTPSNPSGGPTSPAGGPLNYSFTTKSGFLPKGLVLSFRTGQITGTPAKYNSPRTYKFMVCAYTSMDNRWDACFWTSMKLV